MCSGNVQQIYASLGAFVAVRADGGIATWGHPAYGGDSSNASWLERNYLHPPTVYRCFPRLLYTLATNIFILNVFLIRCACTRHRHSYRMQDNVPFYRSGSQPDSPVLPAFKSQSNRKTRSHEKQLKHNHSFSHLK